MTIFAKAGLLATVTALCIACGAKPDASPSPDTQSIVLPAAPAVSVTISRKPNSFTLTGESPEALPDEAKEALEARKEITERSIDLKVSGPRNVKVRSALEAAVKASLQLLEGEVRLDAKRITVKGTFRNTADKERLDLHVLQASASLGITDSVDISDLALDANHLYPDEGFIRRVDGGPLAGDKFAFHDINVEGGAVSPDSEGRLPSGVYHFRNNDLHYAVAPGRTTWLRMDSPSILIADKRFALDAPVKVILPGEAGALGFATKWVDGKPEYQGVGKDKLPIAGPRYETPGRMLEQSGVLSNRDFIRHVVLHSDLAGDSAEWFKSLLARSLSTHFLIDWDGTIYQMTDVGVTAYHAGELNMRSIGIDLNNLMPNLHKKPKASPYPAKHPRLAEMQSLEYQRPVSELVEINYAKLKSYGYTNAQYASLGSLLRTLAAVYPALAAGPPRDDMGQVAMRAMENPGSIPGILAHWHGEMQRWDPGPGFDWKRLGLDEKPAP
jgi:N-acetyl-anhydromuramyl-L-alanine amidase AmpD